MKTITKYVSNDGVEFSTVEECVEYENVNKRVDNVMLFFKQRIDDCDFENGEGFIQQKRESVIHVKRGLTIIAAQLFDLGWAKEMAENEPENINPHCIISRFISDSSYKCLDKAWFRLMCIDEFDREWGQPYFAAHPTKGKQIEI